MIGRRNSNLLFTLVLGGLDATIHQGPYGCQNYSIRAMSTIRTDLTWCLFIQNSIAGFGFSMKEDKPFLISSYFSPLTRRFKRKRQFLHINLYTTFEFIMLYFLNLYTNNEVSSAKMQSPQVCRCNHPSLHPNKSLYPLPLH